MKVAGCILFLGALLASVDNGKPGVTLTRTPPASVCGSWVVRKVVPTSNIQASPNKAFLGQRAAYTSSKMSFGDRLSVARPLYRVERLSRAEFFTRERISASELGIRGDAILEITVLDRNGRDVDAPGTYLDVVNRSRIIAVWDGVSYELDRVGPPCGKWGSK